MTNNELEENPGLNGWTGPANDADEPAEDSDSEDNESVDTVPMRIVPDPEGLSYTINVSVSFSCSPTVICVVGMFACAVCCISTVAVFLK